jgi:hypothetical protein
MIVQSFVSQSGVIAKLNAIPVRPRVGNRLLPFPLEREKKVFVFAVVHRRVGDNYRIYIRIYRNYRGELGALVFLRVSSRYCIQICGKLHLIMRDCYNRLCATRAPNYAWITSAIHGLTVKSLFFQ